MPNILSIRPGKVVKLPGANHPDGADTTILRVAVENWGRYEQAKAIISKVGVHERVSAQVLNTLQNFVYVYIFGDMPNTFQVSGYCFAHSCPLPGQESLSGFDSVMKYYLANRASNRRSSLLIGLGQSIALSGILVDSHLESMDPSTSIGQFSFTFICPPRDPLR